MKPIIPIFIFLWIVGATPAADDASERFGDYHVKAPERAPAFAPKDQYSLIALPEMEFPGRSAKFFPILFCNRTADTLAVCSCGGTLFIVQQAQDADGNWRSIERQPKSWCGNSYFNVSIKPGQAWKLAGVHQSGSFKTKLRFKLNKKSPVYSNEFEGSIDPAQFTLPTNHLQIIKEMLLKQGRLEEARAVQERDEREEQ